MCFIYFTIDEMVAELRKVGGELVLYTDDNLVRQRFHKWPHTLCKVPYTQSGKLVGVDLYFDKKVKHTIIQVVNGQFTLGI